jgi:hypothetical protein
MAGFSNSLSQAVIQHFVRRNTQAVPGGTYLALFVADPTDANITTNEVTAGWYGRQNVASWTVPSGSTTSTSNSNALAFNPVTGSAVTISHWGIYDASVSGNLLYSGALTDPRTLNVYDQFVVDANAMVLDFL